MRKHKWEHWKGSPCSQKIIGISVRVNGWVREHGVGFVWKGQGKEWFCWMWYFPIVALGMMEKGDDGRGLMRCSSSSLVNRPRYQPEQSLLCITSLNGFECMMMESQLGRVWVMAMGEKSSLKLICSPWIMYPCVYIMFLALRWCSQAPRW